MIIAFGHACSEDEERVVKQHNLHDARMVSIDSSSLASMNWLNSSKGEWGRLHSIFGLKVVCDAGTFLAYDSGPTTLAQS